jgi:hypothetical protein
MKMSVLLFIDKKTHLLVIMDFWSWKICVVWLDHHKMKKEMLIHIPNLLLGLNI